MEMFVASYAFDAESHGGRGWENCMAAKGDQSVGFFDRNPFSGLGLPQRYKGGIFLCLMSLTNLLQNRPCVLLARTRNWGNGTFARDARKGWGCFNGFRRLQPCVWTNFDGRKVVRLESEGILLQKTLHCFDEALAQKTCG